MIPPAGWTRNVVASFTAGDASSGLADGSSLDGDNQCGARSRQGSTELIGSKSLWIELEAPVGITHKALASPLCFPILQNSQFWSWGPVSAAPTLCSRSGA